MNAVQMLRSPCETESGVRVSVIVEILALSFSLGVLAFSTVWVDLIGRASTRGADIFVPAGDLVWLINRSKEAAEER